MPQGTNGFARFSALAHRYIQAYAPPFLPHRHCTASRPEWNGAPKNPANTQPGYFGIPPSAGRRTELPSGSQCLLSWPSSHLSHSDLSLRIPTDSTLPHWGAKWIRLKWTLLQIRITSFIDIAGWKSRAARLGRFQQWNQAPSSSVRGYFVLVIIHTVYDTHINSNEAYFF